MSTPPAPDDPRHDLHHDPHDDRGTRTIAVRSSLQYDVVDTASFAMAVVAARTLRQRVLDETTMLDPPLPFDLVPYGEGGTHQLVRFDAGAGPVRLTYAATVEIDLRTDDPATLPETDFRDVPAEVLPYLNPSRYCESDELGDLADRHFGDLPRGWSRVQAVSDWVGREISYEAGSTDGSSSAADVLLQRAGVCRDFAHVAISLCRALGIPARYVAGYGIGVTPQDFHGFFEAYLDGDWWLFDPTGMAPTDGLVRIGYGRDAADASFATFVGAAALVDKTIEVSRRDDEPVGDEPAAAANA